ncbi:hypothetical protein Z517_01666 [Fonsecaea pedrosoi CBS 271.37]|uniref:NACHT domain-containing protein n=1 Tax=Fonsecaea pedrosoi CBS 271.37 TaxID=1442368 RepID=A0A0D2E7Z4_9EURO|nr:uncharacterized protein Z517_01666 [Fonsecaea pedrosoi CBS 271.37]KIW86271.1 hypothetical protein Z517_01666 [Fonsecaea pedrosoi CBS 271.37]
MAQMVQMSQAVQPHRPLPQPLQISFERFRATLGVDEQAQFQHTQFEDVVSEVQRLERKQAASSRTRKIQSRIGPFLDFLERYGRALDSATQARPVPFSLVWGLVRAVLVVSSAHSQYLERLIHAIEDISDKVSLYAEYEKLLKGHVRFQAALAEVYYDTLVFLHKAKTVFSKRGLSLLWRNVWRTFDLDFRDTLRALSRHTLILDNEIALSNDTKVVDLWKGYPEARQNISRWLSPADAQDDFLRESNRRISSCGQWLLDHHLFREWCQSIDNRILWIVGPPGSGKTVLSTSIIEHIQTSRNAHELKAVAFFYCSQNSQQNRTTISILATLIAQIIAQFEDLPEVVLKSYNRSTKCARPRLSMADQPLLLITSLCGLLDEVYILIDGLDEAESPDEVLRDILALTGSTVTIRTLILSRDLPRLTRQLGSHPHSILKIKSRDTRADIDMFVTSQLSKLDFVDTELRDKMFAKLSQGADGMFLWASLLLQSLTSATSTYDAMDIISNHPVGLSLTYNAILERFKTRSRQSQRLTKRFLTWMCCAARPVGWNELTAALAVGRIEEIPFKEAMLEICSPLVEYLPDQDIFRFVHISVREFLLDVTENHSAQESDDGSSLPFREADGHSHIANVCLRYLLQAAEMETNLATDVLFPLSEYAMSFWAYHLVRSRYEPELDEMMHSYLACRRRRLSWIERQLFGEASVFPLQHLVKLQKQLCKWASAGQRERDDRLDWIRDVEQILLDVENVEEQQDFGSETDSTGRAKVTYFEKLMVIRDLSREYTMSNRLDQGERWMTEALRRKQESPQQDELSTVWLLNSLGIIYDQQQKVELAASTQEKALAIQEKHLGTSHPETIWTVNELGRMYRHLKRTPDSISMHLRALAVLETSGDDLQVAWTLNTLARAYRQLGDPVTAISRHREAIAIQEKLLGADHPHVLWATADIGRCYRDQGRFVESAQHHRICLEGRERVLGMDHHDTLWAINDLAFVVEEFDKVEARKLHQQALAGQTLLLGVSHRDTVWTRAQIEKLEAQMGRMEAG